MDEDGKHDVVILDRDIVDVNTGYGYRVSIRTHQAIDVGYIQ